MTFEFCFVTFLIVACGAAIGISLVNIIRIWKEY